MKCLLLFISFGVLFFESYASEVGQNTDTSGRRILIINTFDASQMKARNNKRELFAELADSLKQYLRSEMSNYSSIETVVVEELMRDNTDSMVSHLLQKYSCTSALVIDSLNVYFEQTEVEVTRDDDGKKSREASYDICTEVKYICYANSNTPEPLYKKKCSFFTKRNVASGLLAAGPDVVGKSKYTFIAIRQNAMHSIDEIVFQLKKGKNQ